MADKADMMKAIVSTMDFAAKKHRTQKRKDVEGTPYINHPIGKQVHHVAVLLIDY